MNNIPNILQQLNIPPQKTPEENILTGNSARSVRFHTSKPSGYATSEVDSFILDITIPALDWFQQALYERDQDVLKLVKAYEELRVSFENLQYNRELDQAQGAGSPELSLMVQQLHEKEEENQKLKTYVDQITAYTLFWRHIRG